MKVVILAGGLPSTVSEGTGNFYCGIWGLCF